MDRVPASALAVYAHPDDADVACGGTLARWSRAGCPVHLVICTMGEKGSLEPAADLEQLVALRAEEVAAAARATGLASHRNLGHADGTLDNGPELVAQLVSLVRSVRPEVVLSHDPLAAFFGQSYFNHRDHRSLGWAMLDAVSPAAASPHYFPEAGAPHCVSAVLMSGTLGPEVWVDITATVEIKAAAVACHRSQLGAAAGPARDVVLGRALEAGRQAGVGYAEGFRLLQLGPGLTDPAA